MPIVLCHSVSPLTISDYHIQDYTLLRKKHGFGSPGWVTGLGTTWVRVQVRIHWPMPKPVPNPHPARVLTQQKCGTSWLYLMLMYSCQTLNRKYRPYNIDIHLSLKLNPHAVCPYWQTHVKNDWKGQVSPGGTTRELKEAQEWQPDHRSCPKKRRVRTCRLAPTMVAPCHRHLLQSWIEAITQQLKMLTTKTMRSACKWGKAQHWHSPQNLKAMKTSWVCSFCNVVTSWAHINQKKMWETGTHLFMHCFSLCLRSLR